MDSGAQNCARSKARVDDEGPVGPAWRHCNRACTSLQLLSKGACCTLTSCAVRCGAAKHAHTHECEAVIGASLHARARNTGMHASLDAKTPPPATTMPAPWRGCTGGIARRSQLDRGVLVGAGGHLLCLLARILDGYLALDDDVLGKGHGALNNELLAI
eukprot:UN4744